jgi:hypothetical protein
VAQRVHRGDALHGADAIVGGDSLDIFVPLSFLHDISNLAYAVLNALVL